jgi:hypothetical protein
MKKKTLHPMLKVPLQKPNRSVMVFHHSLVNDRGSWSVGHYSRCLRTS